MNGIKQKNQRVDLRLHLPGVKTMNSVAERMGNQGFLTGTILVPSKTTTLAPFIAHHGTCVYLLGESHLRRKVFSQAKNYTPSNCGFCRGNSTVGVDCVLCLSSRINLH